MLEDKEQIIRRQNELINNLRHENLSQKQSLKWYQDTYENRKIQGIIKDKVNKKVNKAIYAISESPLKWKSKIKAAVTKSDLSEKIFVSIVNYNDNDNAKKLLQNFSRYFNSIVIDSGSDIKEKEFVKFGNIYYSGLFNAAYKIAKAQGYEYIFFICSDVEVEEVELDKMVRNLKRINLAEIGLYSPSSTGRSHKQCKRQSDSGLRVVDFMEGFVFMAQMSILDKFAPIDINTNLFGWGLDVVKGYFSKQLGYINVIDDGVSVYHPGETGYSNAKAETHMDNWFNTFEATEELQNFLGNVKFGYAEHHKVSIIIPAYNQKAFIKDTLFSIFAQLFSNYEIIIVDDGSSDGTQEYLQYYIDNYSQIKYIRQKNKGLSGARNTGLKHATGSLIQFLDSDDTMTNTKLLFQVIDFIQKDNVDISYTPYQCFEDGNPENMWTYSRVNLNENPQMDLINNWEKDLSIPIHCFLFKHEFIKDIYFDETLPNHEDWHFHLQVAARFPNYAFCPEGTAFYRVRTDSMSSDNSKMRKGKGLCLQDLIARKIYKDDFNALLKKRLFEVKMVIGISTTNVAQQNLIRDTWAKEMLGKGYHYFFLENAIVSESKIDGDRFVANMKNEDRSKMISSFMSYFLDNADFEYFMFVDKDIYINVDTLEEQFISEYDLLISKEVDVQKTISYNKLISKDVFIVKRESLQQLLKDPKKKIKQDLRIGKFESLQIPENTNIHTMENLMKREQSIESHVTINAIDSVEKITFINQKLQVKS